MDCGQRDFLFNDMTYQQCSLSLMDNVSDPLITFDDKGISNYYWQYQKAKKSVLTGQEGQDKINQLVQKMKLRGRGNQYDTILGVSGGVDSTYLAFLAKKLGLRVLLFHFDNGWNSELAVDNIERLSKTLEFDLYTHVVDWDEFRDVQLAYFQASVVDIEAITDHAAMVATRRLADKFNVKDVIIGTNIVTESVLPSYWIFNKNDGLNLISIHKKFGKLPLKNFPVLKPQQLYFYNRVKGQRFHSLLNYVDYNKKDVVKIISSELGWRDYGGKHYESVFTRFYQGYILPAKFNVDKRKAHLSNLIFSGQITKEEALKIMKQPIYEKAQYDVDYPFVLKKLGFTDEQFKAYIEAPRNEHTDYRYYKNNFWDRYPVLKPFRQTWVRIKSNF